MKIGQNRLSKLYLTRTWVDLKIASSQVGNVHEGRRKGHSRGQCLQNQLRAAKMNGPMLWWLRNDKMEVKD